MKGAEELPRELVWTSEGHLSEVAMTAIADGEEAILPRDAFGHLGICEICATGVENAASLSITVNRALTAPAPEQVARTVEARIAFPVGAAALAVAIGIVATLPNLGAMRTWLRSISWALLEGVPVLSRHAATFLPRAWNLLPMMSLTAAMFLLLAGLSVAHLAPRDREMRIE